MNKEEVLKVAHICGIDFYEPEINDEPAGWLEAQIDEEVILDFAAAMYTKGAEDMREQADDAWADALQSDCEHGVKRLSENAANKLRAEFPALAKLGETIRALPITTDKGEQGE